MQMKKKRLIIAAGTAASLAAGLSIGCKSLNKKEKNSEEMSEKGTDRTLPPEATFYERYIKRALDMGLSFCGIIMLSPVLAISSATVFLEDPGPVVFKQKRVGIHKTYFQIHKLRSMKLNTPDVPTHLMENPEQYILKTGKIYRKISVDELYQLFDILRGRMSIVGPRPALWNQDDLIAERDKYGANDVLPGLTGWAQINGRDELEIPVKAQLDGEYCQALRKSSWSGFKMDCKCFFGTIKSVLSSEGVVEGGTGTLESGKRHYTDGKSGEELIGHIGFGESVEIEPDAKKKVLITGAGSYIGESFKAYAAEHYPENFEIDELNMMKKDWKETDFSKYQIVYHVAGIAHADVGKVSDETKEKYYAVNTDLAVEAAKKAKEDGVKTFVFMSSMIVYGDSAPYGNEKVVDRYTIPQPANFYGDSKLQADMAVRELADDDFKVMVLRPPMIYGKGSKGNYPLLAKIAKKLPVFPDVENHRSMLYIENLCEFLCQIMLIKEQKQAAVVLLPQNAEWTKTSEMLKEIAEVSGKKITLLKLLKPAVIIGGKVPGKVSGLVDKAFGNSCYEQDDSVYAGICYQASSVIESIKRTEKNIKKKILNKVCIINCFDTYEHRVDLLHDYFRKIGADVSVYTSDFKHFEKCRRNDKKDDFVYFHAKPYKKNMSIARLKSHKLLTRDIFKEVEKHNFDLLWILVPPNSFVKAGSKYKKKNPSVKLIFDLIDLWPETMPISKFKSFPPFTCWRNLRDKYLNAADEIVTECNLYQQKLPKRVKNKLQTIYLAREAKEQNMQPILPQDKISLCYLGSINNIIDIPAIADLIFKIRRYKGVELHIIGDGEKREELISACKEAGARVIYHGKVYNAEEKASIFASCHYGLNIMKKTVFVGLTMKSIDYFEAGLPIINNIHGDTWDMVNKFAIGFNMEPGTDFSKIVDYSCAMRINTRKVFSEMLSVECFEKKVEKCIKYNKNI